MDRIDEVYVFISSDETGEGVIGMRTPDGWMPMIAADKARLDSLIPLAKGIARTSGKLVKLVRMTTREEIEEYTGT